MSTSIRTSPIYQLIAIAIFSVLVGAALPVGAAEEPTLKDVFQGGSKEVSPDDQAAKKPEAKPQPRPRAQQDELGRDVPRTSVKGFVKAATDRDYERAAQYLDLRNLPPGLTRSDGPNLARKLKIVLDRTLWIDFDDLSADPRGQRDDSLPTYRDHIGQITIDDVAVDILLQRVPRGDGVFIWKVSTATVARIPELYEHFGYGRIGEALAAVFPEFEVLGLQTWQWAAVLGLLVAAYAIAFVPMWVIALLLRRRGTAASAQLARFFTGPLQILLTVVLARQGLEFIGLSVEARALVRGQTLMIIVVAWAATRGIGLIRDHMRHRLTTTGRESVTVLLRPAANALKVVLVLGALLFWLDNIGFSVTALLAGLGVGGLAVALAAQKSIEDLIGAITLYASQPVRVGDACRFGGTFGIIEEIGLRSTRVRTLDRTTITIPNAEFANLQLENFSTREKTWYHPRIRLRYETTPDQIRYILVEIRKLFYSHPKVEPDPARIRFVGYGEYSHDLEVFAYVGVSDPSEYLEITEDLNLRIMDIIAQAGSAFAVPSQTMYVERGNRLNTEAVHTTEAQVRQWREKEELYLPKFPPTKIDELRGSLEYPPKGSAPVAATS